MFWFLKDIFISISILIRSFESIQLKTYLCPTN